MSFGKIRVIVREAKAQVSLNLPPIIILLAALTHEPLLAVSYVIGDWMSAAH